MTKEDKKALFGLPIVLLLGIGFIVAIGSTAWSTIDLTKALYPVLLAFVLQWIAFIPAYNYRTEKFYDLVGGISFIITICLCWILAKTINLRSIILVTMVVLWAGRLGIFLFVRIKRAGKDRRFNAIKQSFPRFLIAIVDDGILIVI